MPRKMKESGVEWLGQIPEGWDCLPARCVFREVKDKNVSGEETRQLSFRYGEIVDKRGNDATKEAEEETITAYRIVTPNTIMVNGLNLNYDFVTQRVAIVRKRGIITSAYLAVSANEQMLKTAFALYLLKGYDSKQVLHGHGSGIRKTLKFEDFKDIKISLPPLPEQERIAAFLDERCAKIDGMIAEAKAGIEDYKKWKQSIIFEAVTGKREKNLKSSGVDWIGDVPEGWKVCAMKTVIDILPGYAFESGAFANSEGIRLLRGVNVSVDSLRWDETVYWNASVDDKLAAYLIKENDLIVGLDRPWISGGTRAVLAKESDLPCLLVQRVCRIRAKEGNDVRFLLYLLKQEGFEKELSVETTGVSVPHISTKQIENFKVPLPSVNVQHRIAAELDEKCAAIDKLVGEKEALIADLEAYKKSLIFETVTGKREVA